MTFTSGNPFQKKQRKDPLVIPAAAYNAFIDAAMAEKARTLGIGHKAIRELFEPDVILVMNTTGGALDRFDIVGLEDPIVDPGYDDQNFKNVIGLDGNTPEAVAHDGKFAVLQEPLASGAIGRAVVSGATVVHLRVNNPLHRFADIIDGETGALQTTPRGGAAILWMADPMSGTSADVWAVVRLGNMPPLQIWGKITGAAAKVSVLTIPIDDVGAGDTFTFTATWMETGYDAEYTVASSSETPADTASGWASLINGKTGDPWGVVTADADGSNLIVTITNDDCDNLVTGAAATSGGTLGATIDSACQWFYTFEQRIRLACGWATPDNPISGSCINSIEEPNDGAGIEGNGVDVDDTGATVTLLSLAAGAPIVPIVWEIDEDGDDCFTCSQMNPISVTC